MLKSFLTALMAIATGFSLLPAPRVGAAELPETIQAGDNELVLNGYGTRSKYLLDLYMAGLYVTRPSSDSRSIITADEPMAMRIEIKSGFVSQEKLVDSLNEGFYNSTNGNQGPIQTEIEQFRQCFREQITKGDIFDLLYIPTTGLVVIKNGTQKGVIQGLTFKQAVFGIWLSDRPADEKLKRALLQARTASSTGGRRR